MKKIGIMADSHSGILKQEAEELDIHVLPMPFYLNGELFHEILDFSRKGFYEKLREGADVSTSQPSPQEVMEMWDEMLLSYDQILYIPLSSSLSGSCMTAAALSQEPQYKNKVFVVDNGRVSTPLHRSILDAIDLVEDGYTAQQIKDILEASREKTVIYVGLSTLEYLKKGGRISKSVAMIGGMLSIKPVVTVEDGVVAVLGKARGSKNGNNLLVKEIQNAGGIDFSLPFWLGYTGINDALLQKYIQDSEVLWKDYTEELPICTIGATIGTHVGPNAVAVAFFGKEG